MKTLGKKIRLLRHQKSWSQEDVAKQLEISIPAFSKIETGITDINLSRLEQISKLFEMTVVQLLTFNDKEGQESYNTEVDSLTLKLHEREMELIDLQKKIIELYEELRAFRK
ncbi:Helix-turn-helix domain-containing protein [Daejeonella rubra]|uniref:Helix-turn-helix domain-containing protein n=1 Tax=Daejeonella rubra TaxID=990371 RepID=A0A1G9LXP7_9SPHI|nr:helix-turn-helix transcriptional regulator [Daejeonella rubra]SDL66467.1 Helix-turn-helix domain-containing protein [Daejeonella rubra]